MDLSCIFNKEFSLAAIQRFCYLIIFPSCDTLVRWLLHPHILLLTVVEHGESLQDHGSSVVEAIVLEPLMPAVSLMNFRCLHCHFVWEHLLAVEEFYRLVEDHQHELDGSGVSPPYLQQGGGRASPGIGLRP